MDKIDSLRLYILAKYFGWQDYSLPERFNDVYSLANPEINDSHIYFPKDSTVNGAERVLKRTLLDIADFLNRRPEELLSQFEYAAADRIALSISSEKMKDSIPMVMLEKSIQTFKELLTESAEQVLHDKSIQESAQAIFRSAQFGHTQKGSFIVTALIPTTQNEQQPLTGASSFPRLVSKNARRLLVELTEHLKSPPSAKIFSKAYESLSALYDQNLDNSIKISMNWSRLLENEDPMPPEEFNFEPQVLKEDIPKLLGKPSPEQIGSRELQGKVKALKGKIDEDNGIHGTVTIVALIDGNSREISINLEHSDHLQAIEAYKTGTFVKFSGIVTRTGKSYKLTRPDTFSIVAEA